MTSTALVPIDRPHVTQSYEMMRCHLSVKSLDAPRLITEEPPIRAELAMAAIHLALAFTFIADVVRRILLRVSRPWSLTGLIGWLYAIFFTAILIWR
jgi:hypothetical protein